MLKKTSVLLTLCFFVIAAMPAVAPAAQPLTRQNLVKKNIAGLQKQLLTGAALDPTALQALTIQFLDDLAAVGFKKNSAALELATQRYVADIQEQAAAAPLDLACVVPLVINVTTIGSGMLAEAASLDTPLCKTISLSASAAGIVSSTYSYDLCVLENSADPDNATIAAIEQKQQGIEIFTFGTSALHLFFCTTAPTAQDYINLLLAFIRLFE